MKNLLLLPICIWHCNENVSIDVFCEICSYIWCQYSIKLSAVWIFGSLQLRRSAQIDSNKNITFGSDGNSNRIEHKSVNKVVLSTRCCFWNYFYTCQNMYRSYFDSFRQLPSSELFSWGRYISLNTLWHCGIQKRFVSYLNELAESTRYDRNKNFNIKNTASIRGECSSYPSSFHIWLSYWQMHSTLIDCLMRRFLHALSRYISFLKFQHLCTC